MIIKARARAGGSQLAAYLLNRDGDERAAILETRGLDSFSGNLRNALIGMEIDAKASGCEKPLYHASFRLEEGAKLTPDQWREAADRLEKKLGMEGHERALIMHEGPDGKHLHVVWNRIDQETLEPTRLEFDAYKRLDVARELERDFHTRELSNEHTQDRPTRADHEQAKRAGRDVHDIKAEIREAWERSDNGTAFENALADAGYILAQGDKRDFVAVDPTGQEYTIGKRITGAAAAQVRAKCADLDRDLLPTAAQAREYQQERAQEREREAQARAACEREAAQASPRAPDQEAEKAETFAPTRDSSPPVPEQPEQQPPRVLTPEERAERAAFTAARKAAIRDCWAQSEDGIEFAVLLSENDLALAYNEKDGKAWLEIVQSDRVSYKLTPKLLNAPSVDAIREKLGDLDPRLFDSADQARQALRAARAEDFAAARAIERRDAADAAALEKGQFWLLETRAEIREAWEKAESGQAFAADLKARGLELARADRPNSPYTVVNDRGHALNVAFTVGLTGTATREALRDLDPATLRRADKAQVEARAAVLTQERAAAAERAATLAQEREAKAEITQARAEGMAWQRAADERRTADSPSPAKEAAKVKPSQPDREKAPAPSVGRAAAAVGNGLLNLADGLLGGLAGPVTHEQIRQQAAGTQQRTAEHVRDAAAQLKTPLTPQEREAKAREFDRAAAEATRARQAYKDAQANAKGEERRAAMRAEFRAEHAAKVAERQAALMRETEQQRQTREAQEREEREAERRRRERQRER